MIAKLTGCQAASHTAVREWRAVDSIEGMMSKELKEYLVAELLDHPVLGVLMTSEGIERRSVELMLDTESRERRRLSDRDSLLG